MESAANTFIDRIAEFGPWWMLAAALVVLFGYVVYVFTNVYKEVAKDKRARDQEMLTISGQMVAQMDRSNTVLESVEEQMAVMNETNSTLVETLLKSQERSQGMHDMTKKISDRVEFMYQHIITKGVD